MELAKNQVMQNIKKSGTLYDIKIHFNATKDIFFKKHIDTGKIYVSNKISSGEKNYNDHQVKPLHTILFGIKSELI